MPLLELQSVAKHFGGLQVVNDLSFSGEPGEIVSLIGPNGAGKTTVLNLITGLYQPDGGDICFNGKSISGLETHQITQTGIARTFQSLRLFLNMSVIENVMSATYGHTHATPWESIFRLPRARRDEPQGDRRGDRGDLAPPRGARDRDSRDRARHARRRQLLGSRDRARPW